MENSLFYTFSTVAQVLASFVSALENYRLFLETWKNADTDIPEVIAARNFLGN